MTLYYRVQHYIIMLFDLYVWIIRLLKRIIKARIFLIKKCHSHSINTFQEILIQCQFWNWTLYTVLIDNIDACVINVTIPTNILSNGHWNVLISRFQFNKIFLCPKCMMIFNPLKILRCVCERILIKNI